MSVKKIAFLYLTIHNLNQLDLWNIFYTGNEHLSSIYVHPKQKDRVTDNILRNNVISELVETQWGHYSLVKAMINLLREAIKNSANYKFVFLSESCIPIKPFIDVYNELTKDNNSYINYNNDNHMYRFEQLCKTDKFIKKTDWYTCSQWCILNREHVNMILETENKYLPLFKNVFAADEHYFIVLIKLNENNNLVNKMMTYVKWGHSRTHPNSYGILDKQVFMRILMSKSLFARKFLSSSNVKALYLEIYNGGPSVPLNLAIVGGPDRQVMGKIRPLVHPIKLNKFGANNLLIPYNKVYNTNKFLSKNTNNSNANGGLMILPINKRIKQDNDEQAVIEIETDVIQRENENNIIVETKDLQIIYDKTDQDKTFDELIDSYIKVMSGDSMGDQYNKTLPIEMVDLKKNNDNNKDMNKKITNIQPNVAVEARQATPKTVIQLVNPNVSRAPSNLRAIDPKVLNNNVQVTKMVMRPDNDKINQVLSSRNKIETTKLTELVTNPAIKPNPTDNANVKIKNNFATVNDNVVNHIAIHPVVNNISKSIKQTNIIPNINVQPVKQNNPNFSKSDNILIEEALTKLNRKSVATITSNPTAKTAITNPPIVTPLDLNNVSTIQKQSSNYIPVNSVFVNPTHQLLRSPNTDTLETLKLQPNPITEPEIYYHINHYEEPINTNNKPKSNINFDNYKDEVKAIKPLFKKYREIFIKKGEQRKILQIK